MGVLYKLFAPAVFSLHFKKQEIGNVYWENATNRKATFLPNYK